MEKGPLQRQWPPAEQEAYIRALPLWKHPIRLEPLAGGLQNRNFVARDGDARYVVRIASDLIHLGGVLSSSNAAMEAGSSAGVSPQLVYQEPSLSVVEWIEGRNLTIEDFADPATIAPVVERIKALQAASSTLRGPMTYFEPFLATRQAQRMCLALNAKKMDRYGALIERLVPLERHFGLFRPVLAHCDLAYVNVMRGNDGRYWLIDYDLAGFGPPEWDIAELAAYSYTSNEIDRLFVKSYYGRQSEADFERGLFRHRAYKMTSLIRVIYLLLILDARLGEIISGDELAASMAENFASVGGDYLEFADTHHRYFETLWAEYGALY